MSFAFHAVYGVNSLDTVFHYISSGFSAYVFTKKLWTFPVVNKGSGKYENDAWIFFELCF